MGKLIAIDLGTTNSRVAVMEGGAPKVIPNQEGERTTPSVVAFTAEGERLVGQIATRQALANPTNTVFAVKRLIGRKFDSSQIDQVRRFLPYQLVQATNGDVQIQIEDKIYSPPEISSFVLRKLKAAAEDYMGEPVEEAIITVPAYFNYPQRQATKDAGLIAGLKVGRLINSSTAAALAYGLKNAKGQFVAVYDLGGGTFDITILEMTDGLFQVRATGGDTFLGGEDFDQRIVNWLIDEFQREVRIDLKQNRMALQRLKETAEKVKCELSTAEQTEIVLPFISTDTSRPKHMNIVLSRQKYESLTDDLLERTIEPCRRCLADANMRPDQIDEVLLVGGQTRAPKVAEIVRKVFGKEPNRAVNPDEEVAMGAAIQTGIIAGEVKDLVLLDVTPHTLGIETGHGTFTPLITRNSTIPTRTSRVFTTVDDNQSRVEVHVLQGESDMAAYNKSLVKFVLTNIPPAPKGVPQIEVTFEIDVNGIVSVGAQEQATGNPAIHDARVCVPSQIGRYRILAVLGQGAIGTTYRGRDELLNLDVAIKICSPDPKFFAGLVSDADLRARFLHEGKVTGRLRHPNIVAIHDLGDDEGVPYMTFELLDGMTLLRAIEAGISLNISLHVIVQVLAGLAHVHQQGIVHRDIKPANIFIQADGSVKIVDFGVATTASMTGTSDIVGTPVGTPDYMSPEQVKGSKVDGRSDLFALGCVLYELVAGRRPFHSDNLTAILFKTLQQEPEMELIPEGPQWERLRGVITRALRKKPEDRYPDARAMSTDLLQALEELGWSADRKTPAPPPAPTPRHAAATHPPRINLLKPAPAISRTPPVLGFIAAAMRQIRAMMAGARRRL